MNVGHQVSGGVKKRSNSVSFKLTFFQTLDDTQGPDFRSADSWALSFLALPLFTGKRHLSLIYDGYLGVKPNTQASLSSNRAYYV